MKVGHKIGRPVKVDDNILHGARGRYARLCVEVDLSHPLLAKFRLRRRVKRLDYEGLHQVYFACGCYGHRLDSSLQKGGNRFVAENVGDSDDDRILYAPIPDVAPVTKIPKEVTESFKPWMLAKKLVWHKNLQSTKHPGRLISNGL